MNLTDDPYCEACFKTIHAKGKKARHKWTPIGEEKVSEDTGQAEGEYNAGGEGGVDGFLNAEAENAWEEHFDDEAGCAYWYNTTTGESSYSNPFGDAAADVALGYGSAEAYQTDYDGAVGYDDAAGTQDWRELFDENSGQSYWYWVKGVMRTVPGRMAVVARSPPKVTTVQPELKDTLPPMQEGGLRQGRRKPVLL